MNKCKTIFIQLLFIFAGSKYVNSQVDFFMQCNEKLSKIQYEKVYLHIDRNIYSIKDDIWFKIYLLDGKTHIPVWGINTVYVDLVSPFGETLIHKPFLIESGTGRGSFNIPDSLQTGTYTIYAYTNYLKNFGINSFYKKEIIINYFQLKGEKLHTEDGQTSLNVSEQAKHRSLVDLRFMPEGGYLSNNLPNVLAFKISGYDGKGINKKGIIIDRSGNFIDSIQSTHMGMGKIVFQPQEANSYYAILDDFPADTFMLPSAIDKPLLQYLGMTGTMVHFRICDLLKTDRTKTYYLAIKSKGEITFYLEKEISRIYTRIFIHSKNFRPGINQVILLDTNFTPLAERLFLIPEDHQIHMDIRMDKEIFKTREKTEINLKITNSDDSPLSGSFSIAVVNLDQSGINEMPSENIISFLDLESEIRGKIENPGYYFSNSYDNIKENLDLLFLTQGWTSYIWSSEFVDSLKNIEYEKEQGLTISGQAQRLLLNRALNDGNIILFVPNEYILLEATTDSNGYFHFDNLILYDSTKIFVQSRNKNNKQNSRLVDANYVISPPPYFPANDIFSLNDSVLVSYNSKAYERFISNSYFNFDKDHILIDEVTIVGHKKEKDDGHFRLYSQANNVIDMDDYPNTSYSDLFMFLQGMVPGLYIEGDNISIRRAQAPPLILLDGIEIDVITARNIPLVVVDKIEVLKDASNTAVFGVRGGNGVIAIYTRRGENIIIDTPLFDVISKSIEGYAKAKKFYSPDFNNPGDNKIVTDQRATLFWGPDLQLDSDGSCIVSFFNSDDTGKAEIIVEGITFNGKPCFAKANYWIQGR